MIGQIAIIVHYTCILSTCIDVHVHVYTIITLIVCTLYNQQFSMYVCDLHVYLFPYLQHKLREVPHTTHPSSTVTHHQTPSSSTTITTSSISTPKPPDPTLTPAHLTHPGIQHSPILVFPYLLKYRSLQNGLSFLASSLPPPPGLGWG